MSQSDEQTARICHIHTDAPPLTGYCHACLTAWTQRSAAAEMTGEARAAEVASWYGPLEIPFEKVHQRLEELIGRPVWTHELALSKDMLIEEARTWQHGTFADVLKPLEDHGIKTVLVTTPPHAREEGAR